MVLPIETKQERVRYNFRTGALRMTELVARFDPARPSAELDRSSPADGRAGRAFGPARPSVELDCLFFSSEVRLSLKLTLGNFYRECVEKDVFTQIAKDVVGQGLDHGTFVLTLSAESVAGRLPARMRPRGTKRMLPLGLTLNVFAPAFLLVVSSLVGLLFGNGCNCGLIGLFLLVRYRPNHRPPIKQEHDRRPTVYQGSGALHDGLTADPAKVTKSAIRN
ncbi:hypothetical protein DY000_02013597 [Brassica cretica]|uniref:Uncharacterized protein n=1 Tax=Brassica cretica TaxID=69181 RepID=A0ABQ7CXY8_BRACR|nr:hypothetical protein DY000_02013597 [Brassica cretica]